MGNTRSNYTCPQRLSLYRCVDLHKSQAFFHVQVKQEGFVEGPARVLQSRHLDPDGYFWHPTYRAYFQSRILSPFPHFALKSRIPLQIRNISIQFPKKIFWGPSLLFDSTKIFWLKFQMWYFFILIKFP